MAKHVKVGDIYQVVLRDGRCVFAQYLLWNDQMGCLVKIFSRFLDCRESFSITELETWGDMFPPVFVGLKAAVKAGLWKKIGTMPVTPFPFPLFRCTSAHKPGTYENWWLWDGYRQEFIGKLPAHLRSLEMEAVWSYEMLEARILTGNNLFTGVI